MRYSAVIFDLDGTVMDSGEGIVRSAEYALAKMGIDCGDRQKLFGFIGPPLEDGFRDIAGLDGEDAKTAVKYYRERYSVKGIEECTPYEGIPELLSDLKAKGVRLYIGSSKPELFVKQILQNHGLDTYFEYVAGATFDGSIGTKEEVLRYLLENIEIDKASTLMIGDRYHDIEGAHAVGLKVAAVLYGFGSKEEFEEYGAEYIAADAADLLKIITE